MTQRGRPTLLVSAPKTVRAMIYLRQFHSMTIAEITRATGISYSSVYKYTRHIPCARRHNITKIFNNKIGIVGTHFVPKMIARAAGRKAK